MPSRSGLKRKSVSSSALKIAVFLGGTSPERKISLRSGAAIADALESLGYEIFRVDPGKRGTSPRNWPSIDAAFIALHGKGGEDGTIQRILSRKKIPYTGSAPKGCRYSFDKLKSKSLFIRNGIPTPESIVIRRSNWQSRVERFGTPFFVKPPCDGSSLGIFCVEDINKQRSMIKRALEKYPSLLLERKVTGREFTVGILGQRALPVIELRPRSAFYDYKTKYTKGMCRYIVPAKISSALTNRLQSTARKAHACLGLRDMSRIDIMTDQDENIFVLEANAIPGFTEFSLLPKAAKANGLEFPQLCRKILKMALKRK